MHIPLTAWSKLLLPAVRSISADVGQPDQQETDLLRLHFYWHFYEEILTTTVRHILIYASRVSLKRNKYDFTLRQVLGDYGELKLLAFLIGMGPNDTEVLICRAAERDSDISCHTTLTATMTFLYDSMSKQYVNSYPVCQWCAQKLRYFNKGQRLAVTCSTHHWRNDLPTWCSSYLFDWLHQKEFSKLQQFPALCDQLEFLTKVCNYAATRRHFLYVVLSFVVCLRLVSLVEVDSLLLSVFDALNGYFADQSTLIAAATNNHTALAKTVIHLVKEVTSYESTSEIADVEVVQDVTAKLCARIAAYCHKTQPLASDTKQFILQSIGSVDCPGKHRHFWKAVVHFLLVHRLVQKMHHDETRSKLS